MKVELQDENGNVLIYDDKNVIGDGTEGNIYRLENGLLVKIFAKSINEDDEVFRKKLKAKEEKIKYMLQNPPKGSLQDPEPYENTGKVSIAWPYHMVYQGKIFVGYAMPAADSFMSLGKIVRSQVRKENAINWSNRAKLYIARRLARAFKNLHDSGLYGVDGNPENYLISRTGWITLIDTDSYQIVTKKGEVLDGNCYWPDMSPKEYLDAVDRKQKVRLTKEGDNHILAMFIFKILMDNASPYVGLVKNPMDRKKYFGPQQQQRATKNGWFVYGARNTIFVPRAGYPDYRSTIPPEIDEGFNACFYTGTLEPTKRPSSDDWIKILSSAIVNVESGNSPVLAKEITETVMRTEVFPLMLVVDVTESLLTNGAWEPLKKNFRNMFTILKDSPYFRDIAFSWIEFASYPKVYNFKFLPMIYDQMISYDLKNSGGCTNLMDAVYEAIDKALSFSELCDAKFMEHKKPKIFIMTDGVSTSVSDHFGSEAEFYDWIEQYRHDVEIVTVAIGKLKDPRELMRQKRMLSHISSNGEIIYLEDFGQDMSSFFKWLSYSVNTISN